MTKSSDNKSINECLHSYVFLGMSDPKIDIVNDRMGWVHDLLCQICGDYSVRKDSVTGYYIVKTMYGKSKDLNKNIALCKALLLTSTYYRRATRNLQLRDLQLYAFWPAFILGFSLGIIFLSIVSLLVLSF